MCFHHPYHIWWGSHIDWSFTVYTIEMGILQSVFYWVTACAKIGQTSKSNFSRGNKDLWFSKQRNKINLEMASVKVWQVYNWNCTFTCDPWFLIVIPCRYDIKSTETVFDNATRSRIVSPETMWRILCTYYFAYCMYLSAHRVSFILCYVCV